MIERNQLGRFVEGYKPSEGYIDKVRKGVIESWKRRGSMAELKRDNPLIYNSWRGIVYSKKYPITDEWKDFSVFYQDVIGSYKKGLNLFRLDLNKPFGRDNFIWATSKDMRFARSPELTYNGVTKKLLEWADEYDLSYQGILQRFRRGKNYTIEEILFGKKKVKRGSVQDINELKDREQKNKVSKMLSAYKIKDKKSGKEFNLTKEYFIENIISKPCFYCGDTEKIGCDRMDNNLGHIIGNVIPCCYVCNVVRNNFFTVEEMKELGRCINIIKGKRK